MLVLLCNTLGVQAETGAPAVTVSSYEELVNAIDQASNLDTILIEAVANTLAKGYKQADPRKRLELIRELDTELAEVYMVRIPVITCGVRDDNYVHSTKEIFLADPELEAFLHQFRHHLQNEARELSRKYLLMEDDPKADYRIPYREANSMLYGEDDAVAWSRFLMENC